MNGAATTKYLLPLLIAGAMLLSCAAGDPRFSPDEPADFWDGLWHGMIALVTLVVGLFNDTVEIYERNNNGGWYDFGFLIGVLCIWGGGSKAKSGRARSRRDAEEWEAVARRVEDKIKRRIREWAEAEPDEAWNVVEEKAEAKLKQRLREWAEKD